MKKILLICLLILFNMYPAIAQKAKLIDSLEHILNTRELKPDSLLNIYDKLCRLSMSYDLELLMKYARKGLSLAKKQNNKLSMANFYENYGIAYSIKESCDSSLIYYNRALDIAIKLKNRETEASIYESMAILFAKEKKHSLTLEYFLKALSIYEQVGNKKRVAALLGNISSLNIALKNYDKAIYYSEKSRVLAEEVNDTYRSVLGYYNLGFIYMNKKEYEKAFENTQKALEISRKYNSKYFEMCSLVILSNIYLHGFDDTDKALEYLNESKKVGNEYGDPSISYYSLCILSTIYRNQNEWRKSEETAFEALQIDSTNIDGIFGLMNNIIVANMYLNNKEKAEEYLLKYEDISEQFIDKNYREIMADMEAKYEMGKKETRITVLEKERKLYIWLGIATVTALLLLMGLVFYRHRLSIQNRKIAEQQIKQLEKDKELIAIHSSLKAEKTERDLIAHDLHDSVSSLLTVVKNNMNLYAASEHTKTNYFQNAFEVLSKSITELRRVVYHLKSFILTKEGLAAALDDFCRFIPNTSFHCKGHDRRFDPDKEYVLYDCACELINNALKHSGASRIDVHLTMDEKMVYLSVADNGAGFDSRETKPGIGLDNIRSNLSAFGGQLDILSEPGKGTEANVEMRV
ncbi:MAG: sensor histidine kinase [Bacteroides sp.]|nr:sensor histidine kinase [Bacteroides sp.]